MLSAQDFQPVNLRNNVAGNDPRTASATDMQLPLSIITLSQQWKCLLLPALLVYILLVHCLRDRRAKSLERRFSPAGRVSFCRMTTNDAQAILKDLTELEFPKFFGFSIIFALFKARSPDALLYS